MTLAKFLTTLHNEVLDHHGEVRNFASLLRCSCLIYRSKSAAAAPVAEFRAKRRSWTRLSRSLIRYFFTSPA